VIYISILSAKKPTTMKKVLITIICFTIISCSSDEKAIEVVLNDVTHGAIIRTLNFNNAEFELDNLNSFFSVDIEEQDEQFGGLLERLDVYVRFKDNTTSTGDFSTNESLIENITAADFGIGASPDNLPSLTLNYTFLDLLNTTGLTQSQVECKDQFLLRLDVILNDGRSFSEGSASSIIIAFNTFFSSPYCYTINVVEPIADDLFTGSYFYTSVLDGPNGPTFGDPHFVEITNGHSNSVRHVKLKHILSHPSNELPRTYEFSIVCDESVFGKNQLSSVIGYCDPNAAPILLGPGNENAPVDLNDDSVFELWFVEGYKGWDGECGFGTAPSRIRFTKQ